MPLDLVDGLWLSGEGCDDSRFEFIVGEEAVEGAHVGDR